MPSLPFLHKRPSQEPQPVGDVILQYYPPSAGPIEDYLDSYVGPMGYGMLLSSPNTEYVKEETIQQNDGSYVQKKIVPQDGIYAPLVNDIDGVPRVAEEFGGDQGIINFNTKLLQMGITPIGDVVVNHCGAESAIWKQALAGDPEMQALFRLIRDPEAAGFANHVNIFGLEGVRRVEELGLYISQTFRPDQIEFDAANRRVRRYFERVIRHMYDMGYRGFRLDAIAYLASRVLQTLDGTHEPVALEFAQFLRKIIDSLPGAFTIAEAGGERNAIAQWLRDKRCHLSYDFGIGPRILHAIYTGNWAWLIDYLRNSPQIDGDANSLNFIRSHDEVQLRYILEMIREMLIEFFGGHADEEFAIFDRMGLNQRLSQLVPNDAALVMALALIILLDGVPMIFLGDAEADQGDIYGHLRLDEHGNKPDERVPSRNPRPWVPQPPLFGWHSVPERPFTPDAMTSATMAQWGNPLSTQQQVRRFIHLRNTHPALQGGLRYDCATDNSAVYAFSRLASEKGEPGKKGDILCRISSSGNRARAWVNTAPWRGKRVARLLTDGRHYLGDYEQGGFRGLRWENAGWIGRNEQEVFLKPYGVEILKVIE
jgi:glycosidase